MAIEYCVNVYTHLSLNVQNQFIDQENVNNECESGQKKFSALLKMKDKKFQIFERNIFSFKIHLRLLFIFMQFDIWVHVLVLFLTH